MGGNRRYSDRPANIPAWAATVGIMLANGIPVSAVCTTCKAHKSQVDLDAIAAKFGPEFSLFDRRTACRREGCNGRVLFMYSAGAGTPMRPCTTGRA